jgi:hypothetical protein
MTLRSKHKNKMFYVFFAPSAIYVAASLELRPLLSRECFLDARCRISRSHCEVCCACGGERALSPLTRLLNGGSSGVFLDQHHQVVGGILDGGNVCLGERLINGEFLAHVV